MCSTEVFRKLGALRSETSLPFRPLSIPSRTLPGDLCGSVDCTLRFGDTGTCTFTEGLKSTTLWVWDPVLSCCERTAAEELARAKSAPACLTGSLSLAMGSTSLTLAFCSFFSFNRACISWSCNCSVSSSSSSSSLSSRIARASFRIAALEYDRLIGDGDGEVRLARRRRRSRPPGVLRRTSWGDLGGQWASPVAAVCLIRLGSYNVFGS